MTTLAGTGKLIRLILRRERLRLGIWVVVLVIVPVFTATAFIDLYPDQASREALAATVASSPALTALLGPLYDSSIGGLTAWRAGTLGAFFVALMAILTMIRHTREEEETGRRELLGATVVGRHAPLVAALAVTIGAGLLVAGLLTAGLAGVGLPLAGSLAFGLGYAGVAAVFAGVGAVAAQLTEASSTARGIGVGIAGVTFLLRMAGDSGGEATEWVAWLSPIGWFSRLRPFAGEEWWVFLLWLGLSALLITTAALVASRRDVGAGALPPRPGPADAAPGLSSPLGLAWRLHRGSVMGWTIGLAVLGAVYGTAGDSIQGMLEGNPQLQEIFEQMGGAQGLTDTFFSTVVGIIALITSAYAIRAVLRLDVEEEAMRAEWVLATATSTCSICLEPFDFRIGSAGPHPCGRRVGSRCDLRGDRRRCRRPGHAGARRGDASTPGGLDPDRHRHGLVRPRPQTCGPELGGAGGVSDPGSARPDPSFPAVESEPVPVHAYPGVRR